MKTHHPRRLRWLLFGVLAASAFKLSACKSSVDPNKHQFSCHSADDCGSGYDCIVQQAGGSLCFKHGLCLDHEECNGVDDNCDGRIDEEFPGRNDPCATGLKGICNSGAQECVDAGIVCVGMVSPQTEICNNQDDDCDGINDNGFDKKNDDSNCGSCGHVCGAGTRCVNGVCHESNCSDGIDNDDAGGADCVDLFCASQLCFIDSSDAGWHCPARLDAGTDGGQDGGVDGGVDAGTDAGVDAGLDAGADGGIDDGGLDAGEPDAGGVDAGGSDGGAPDSGTMDGGGPLGCYPPEADCSNGVDDDLNGLTDCEDPACDGQTCSTGASCTMGNCPPAG